MADDTRYRGDAYRHPQHSHREQQYPPEQGGSHNYYNAGGQQHHRPSAAAYSHNEMAQMQPLDDGHSRRLAHDHGLPPRPSDRHWQDERHSREAYEGYRGRTPHNERIPPTRRNYGERWDNDPRQHRPFGHAEGSSADPIYSEGLIRFPSPDNQQQQQEHHDRHQGDRYPRQYRDVEDTREYRRSPPGHAARYDSDLPEKPRRRPRTAPNQSVILIGIPPTCDGDDVRAFIDEFKPDPSDPSPVEDVTIVMDKQTGMSKRFGFVRFITLEHARAFVEANYDCVFWRSRGSHDIVEDGVKIRIDYASDDRRPGEARPRKREFEQVIREEKPPTIMNDGSKDMGSTPNNVLLLRNLDPLTNETHILTRLENLDDAARDRTKNARGPKRIILIKDRESNASWCFAFAIFPDIECAKAALRTILDPAAFPHGFTIQNRLAAVTFARSGSFIKAYAKTTWSFPDEGEDGQKQEYLYWDDAAYGLFYDSQAYKTALAEKEAEGPKADDVDAFLNSLAGDGVTSSQIAEVVSAPPSINLSLAGVLYALMSLSTIGMHGSTLSDFYLSGPPGQSVKEKKKPTELIVSKKIAVDINKWNQKKAETAPPEVAPDAVTPLPTRANTKAEAPQPQSSSAANVSPLSTLDTESLDHADLSDINVPKCLLCQRQFKSLEVLQKHSKQSELHKNNLNDAQKVADAKEAISKIPASSTASGAVSQYRDRAMERRTALGQPDHPPPPTKRQRLAAVADSPKPVASAPEKEIEQSNIGSKLLASMGWTSGSGLGSTAVGRVAPVQAKAFASGAGIGASQGVTATEKANETWGGKDFGRMKAAQRMAERQKRQ